MCAPNTFAALELWNLKSLASINISSLRDVFTRLTYGDKR